MRWLTCQALLNDDASGLQDGLDEMIQEHEEELAKLREQRSGNVTRLFTEAHVFSEGLGLKILAQKRGMAVEPDGPYMPKALFLGGA